MEFFYKLEMTTHPIRFNLIKVLPAMQHLDETLWVEFPTKHRDWADLMELPKSKTFEKGFNTRQETTCKEKRTVLHYKLHTNMSVIQQF
eukprot:2781420-Ditylum_brightwellii.AAC.1